MHFNNYFLSGDAGLMIYLTKKAVRKVIIKKRV